MVKSIFMIKACTRSTTILNNYMLFATKYSRICAYSNFDPDFLSIKRDAQKQQINFSTSPTTPGPLYYNHRITESEVTYTIKQYA